MKNKTRLATEAVEGAALSLERVHNVEGGDGLPLCVLSVSDCVTDDTLEEGLEDTASLFVDHWEAVRRVFTLEFSWRTYWQRYA